MPLGQNSPGHRPFQLQYTNAASEQLENLDPALRAALQGKLNMIASADPYAHGAPDSVTGHRDRRIVVIEGLLVTFWVAVPVKMITIVRICEADTGPVTPHPEPPESSTSIETRRPRIFFYDEADGEEADGEEEEMYVGRLAGVGAW